MIKQLFLLQGESSDLEEMAHQFQEGAATVTKIDDQFYLELTMEPAKSDQETLAEGEKVFNRVKAICLIQSEAFRPPRISGIARRNPISGKLESNVYIKAQGLVSTSGCGRPTVLGSGQTISPRQPSFGEKALKIALVNVALREALRTYATVKHDWRGLYVVFETIEAARGNIPNSWTTKREISDFTGTACSYEAVGPAARHGFGASQKMAPRMTLSQARALIQKLLRAWMDELIAQDSSEAKPE
jgi:hypothetical protein